MYQNQRGLDDFGGQRGNFLGRGGRGYHGGQEGRGGRGQGHYGDRGRGGQGHFGDRGRGQGHYGDRGRGGQGHFGDRGRGGQGHYGDRGRGGRGRGGQGNFNGHDGGMGRDEQFGVFRDGGHYGRGGQDAHHVAAALPALHDDGDGRRMNEAGEQAANERNERKWFYRTPRIVTLQAMKDKEPHDLLLALTDERSCLKAALHTCDKRKETSALYVALIMELLFKVTECTHSHDVVNGLLLETLRSPFFAHRVPQLVNNEFLEIIATRKLRTDDARECLKNLIRVMIAMLTRVESQAYEALHLVVTGMDNLIRSCQSLTPGEDGVVDNKTQELHQELVDLDNSTLISRLTLMKKKNETGTPADADPPDNFRDYPVIPIKDELNKNNESVFLRANRVLGKYRSIDDYLDVQFRLMREDFVSPLRKGINAHRDLRIQFGSAKRITEVRIYPNARIMYPFCLRSGIGHVIQFDTSSLKRVQWERSKRLLFGSLLCFFSGDFTNVMFATVEDRKAESLSERGELIVKFINERITREIAQQRYVMVESTAYFEAYRHVLSRLKTFTEETLPFPEHLVECQPAVRPPTYLSRDMTRTFDFDCLLAKKGKHPTAVGPLSVSRWPTKEELGLDGSQYAALKTAITKRVALIQGPPGTGKTFLGLKIAQLLLTNVVEPSRGTFGPMLLVCYTNHALDQFLEGIAEFKGSKIVRVGGRSRSEKLKRFALNDIRLEYIRGRSFPQELRRNIGAVKEEIETCQKLLMENSAILKATMEHLLSFARIVDYMQNRDHIRLLAGGNLSMKEKELRMKSWLLGFSMDEFEFAPETEGIMADLVEELLGETVAEEANRVGRRHLALEFADDSDEEEAEINFEDEADFEARRRRLDDDEEMGNMTRLHGEIDKHVERLLGGDFIDLHDEGMIPEIMNDGWQTVRPTRRAQRRLTQRELSHDDRMTVEEEAAVARPWQLPWREKWRLYRLWRHRYQLAIRERMDTISQQYDLACRRHTELRAHSDRVVMSAQDVIAMTTTGAARYGDMLNIIKPKIIIVEEAAEVFESHVVASLSEGCQHLILIGDHKQLRPSPAVYDLARRYSLDVSLFERLIGNNFHHDTLGLQHRMRPEISRLVRHSGLYPELGDHDSVRERPLMMGVSHNVFFIDHEYLESDSGDLQSYSNDFEAKYAVRLCRHFILQGYSPEKITILTLYSGQLFLLKKLIRGKDYAGLTVTVVDNYQGEENDIIILSLVRSNLKNKIGFVGIDNRICVALSRARVGLYVIGNFSLLRHKSKLWTQVVQIVEQEGQLGKGVVLVCQVHPSDDEKVVKTHEDFDRLAPEGGCRKPCGKRLKCGHVCVKTCHPTDRGHQQYRCPRDCGRKCARGLHDCKRKCHQSCGPCKELKEFVVPQCDHKVRAPCHSNEEDLKCAEPCAFVLACGHQCSNKCGEGHTVRCGVRVAKVSPFCGHAVETECWQPAVEARCRRPCGQTLDACGHRCKGWCWDCAEGRLHVPCKHPCARTLVCGHPCRFPCTRNCPPCDRGCELKCEHAQCPDLCGETCTPCRERCTNRCRHGACGRLCYELCDMEPCRHPCRETFRCPKCDTDVQCPSLCGEQCIELCRECDADRLSEDIFFGSEDEPGALFILLKTCGHVVEVSGLDQWMEMDQTAGAVGAKKCPRCTKPITMSSCRRYSNLCKMNIRNVQQVKQKVNSEAELFGGRWTRITAAVASLDLSHLQRLTKCHTFTQSIQQRLSEARFMTDLVVCENIVRIAEVLEQFATRFQSVNINHMRVAQYERLLRNFASILDCVTRRVVTKAELDQCAMEVERLRDYLNIILVLAECLKRQRKPDELLELWNSCEKIIRYTDDTSRVVQRKLEKIKDKVAYGLAISNKERLQIVAAVGLSQGHWYKCVCGHVYAIGECGGPMEVAKCPDCKREIGGQNHSLRQGNAVATEMDGARGPAYPTALM